MRISHMIVALLSGLVFGFGLIESGMFNPAKVLGFLEITGNWDPSLAFVMAGGIAVTAIGYWLIMRTEKPAFADQFSLPTSTEVTKKLLIGAGLFGIGWGLVGLCPGPAFTVLTTSPKEGLIFIGFFFIGQKLISRFA